MRIGSGAWRGRALKVPRGIRPTGARAREALFAIWGSRVAEARLLDLFAGSGAVGLEALSRGASEVVAIEGDRGVCRTLRANFEAIAPGGGWRIETRSLPGGLAGAALGRFDLVFADPPYAFAAWEDLLVAVEPLLAREAEAVVEHGRRNRPPDLAGELTRQSLRTYGETELSFYRSPSPSPSASSTTAPSNPAR